MKKSWKLLGAAKLTDRYQTTIPTSVRKELGLGKKDFIEFIKSEDGHLVLRRARPESKSTEPELSPQILAWLKFIQSDHSARPNQFAVLDETFFAEAKDLTKDIEVDLDSSLDDVKGEI